jgi:hypothetical protein
MLIDDFINIVNFLNSLYIKEEAPMFRKVSKEVPVNAANEVNLSSSLNTDGGNFFKFPRKELNAWDVKNALIKLIQTKDNNLSISIEAENGYYEFNSLDIIGIPKEILMSGNDELVQNFFSETYVTIRECGKDSYKIYVNPRLKGGYFPPSTEDDNRNLSQPSQFEKKVVAKVAVFLIGSAILCVGKAVSLATHPAAKFVGGGLELLGSGIASQSFNASPENVNATAQTTTSTRTMPTGKEVVQSNRCTML